MVPVEKDYLRIFNMLSLHAVAYFSNDYPQTTIDTIVRGIGVYGDLYPADVYTAMLQASHKVLAPRVPLITQTASMGGAELATKKPLGDLLVS